MGDVDMTAAQTAEDAEAKAAAQAAALAACKVYMRVDGMEDDALILALMGAAREYLANTGIKEPEEPSTQGLLYRTALYSLTLHYYDHRDAVGDEASFPTGLRPIINQLKHLGEGPL